MIDRGRGWRRIAISVLFAVGVTAGVTVPQPRGWAAQASTAPRPAVVSFKASTGSLPSGGGTITLTVAVKHASKCTFSQTTPTPKVAGLPATVSCSSGKASRRVRLPADTGAANVSYKFGMTVKGAGGTVTAKPVLVVIKEAPPGITGLSVTPNGLPSTGGAATVTATVLRAAKCVLAVTPALAGMPKAMACAAGTKPLTFSVPATLPGLTGAAAQRYSFTLTASGPNGTSRKTAAETVWPAMTWGAPKAVDPPGGSLGPVDCVTATFCMSLDTFGGDALSFNGKSWSAPVKIEVGPPPDTGYPMTSISCAGTAFCVAGDLAGHVFTYDGSGWSASSPGLPVVSLSCASATFCVALGDSQAEVWDGTSWSAPATVSSDDNLASVSCPAATFCLAVSSAGNSYTFDGTSWGAKTPFDTGAGDVSQVSCGSASMCVAIDQDGQAVTYTGVWAAPVRVANGVTTMYSVSCPSSTFCLADDSGQFYPFDGSTWGAQVYGVQPSQPGDVSCASDTFCVIVEADGSVDWLSGTTWNHSAPPNGPLHGFPYAISCAPGTSFCAAVDWEGDYVTYNGTSWSAPQMIGWSAGLVDSVSCTSATFCMAVDEASSQNGQQTGGHIYTYNGASWSDLGPFGYELTSVSCASKSSCVILAAFSGGVYALTWNGSAVSWPPLLIDSGASKSPAPGVGFVSCARPTFCAAVESGGYALTYNGKSWSAADAIDAGTISGLDAVSCPTATFCTAVDGWGQVFTWNGTTWALSAGLEAGGNLRAVSCTAGRFCAVADLSGNVFTYDGSSWSASQDVDPGVPQGAGITGISCRDPSGCQAVDWEGNVITGTA